MNVQWIDAARRAFQTVYGEKKGAAVCAAVLPGVMRDFRGMLERAAPGELVRETYRTDDGRSDVRLEGRRTASGLSITRLEIGGAAVELGTDELKI